MFLEKNYWTEFLYIFFSIIGFLVVFIAVQILYMTDVETNFVYNLFCIFPDFF